MYKSNLYFLGNVHLNDQISLAKAVDITTNSKISKKNKKNCNNM